MRIGFDAKRVYFNRSGLGNYSRDVIRSLQSFFPENAYNLYTPSKENPDNFSGTGSEILCTPKQRIGKLIPGYWRSFQLAGQLENDGIDVYHGLSGELPNGLKAKKIKSVVTIHDLIFLRYPEWYSPIDRRIYTAKFKYACKIADHIIAISEQTKKDLLHFFNLPEKKISVIYQSCNDAFKQEASSETLDAAKSKFNLPDKYLLYVGTIEDRKNLLNILKALHDKQIDIPLVVVGRKTDYYKKVVAYIEENKLKNVQFLSEVGVEELPAIYQQAEIFIYPSIYEGFGIPILEALYSKVPVITSKGGCFSEVGGVSSVYIDPGNSSEIAEAILYILNSSSVKTEMIDQGYKQALHFSTEVMARSIMNIYTKLTYA